MSTHSDRLKQFLISGGEYDVTFLVGPEKEEVKAHQYLLKIHSPVLKTALAARPTQAAISVTNMKPTEFRNFLEYIYTGTLPEAAEIALPLLQLAVTYKIPDLQSCCSDLLLQSFDESTIVTIFEQACKYELDGLKAKSLDFICKNGTRILKSEEFLNFTNYNLCKVLQRDDLRALNEMEVFDAVMRWGKSQCSTIGMQPTGSNLRKVLDDLIPLVRFPVMDKSDFSLKVYSSGILTSDELISVLVYFNVDPSKRFEIPAGHFDSKERDWPTDGGKEYIMQRLVKASSSCYLRDLNNGKSTRMPYIPQNPDLTHYIRFRVSLPIWVTSIGFNTLSTPIPFISLGFNTPFQAPQIQSQINVKIYPTENPAAVKETTIKKDFSNFSVEVEQVCLLKSVFITPDKWYTLAVTGCNYNASLYMLPEGENGKTAKVKLDNGEDVDFEFAENAPRTARCYTGLTQGFIPTIGFQI